MKIYFFTCPPGPPDNNAYHHQALALAEGLQEMGYIPTGNQDYWNYNNDDNLYAIKAASTHDLNAYDAVVFSSDFYSLNLAHLLPDNLFRSNRNYKLVFIDSSDGIVTPGFGEQFRRVDLVLKSHFNRFHRYPSNFIPWQFGLTHRMIQSALPMPIKERDNLVVSGFRVKHPVRSIVESMLDQCDHGLLSKSFESDAFDSLPTSPVELSYWHQTGRRHYISFYRRLGSALVCNASGGGTNKILRSPLMKKSSIRMRLVRKAERMFQWLPVLSVHQFDSWRFWESLVSGCCTIHCDLSKYGCTLPVSPLNGVHYLGVDLNSLESLSQHLTSSKTKLFEIGMAGREWVIENYSPAIVASRFLEILDYKN